MALSSSLHVLFISLTTVGCINLLVANGQETESETKCMGTVLPGQQQVNFNLDSGYITVNETNGRKLFYLLAGATDKPAEKPIILWLNGGPGCSSIGYGAFSEIGPFRVEKNGNLSLNNYAWNQVANTLFVDAPISTGFSYSSTTSDYSEIGVMFTAVDLYNFILKFMKIYPSNGEIVLAGQQYAAQYITQLSVLIIDGNRRNLTSSIHLKKILLISPTLDFQSDMKGMIDFALYHTLISESLYLNITLHCNFATANFSAICNAALDKYYTLYNVIDILSVYTPLCSTKSSEHKFQDESSTCSLNGYDPCRPEYVSAYLNRLDVQNALYASLNGSRVNWINCNYSVIQIWNDDPLSALPLLKKILKSYINVMIWGGDNNGRNTVLGTLYALKKLGIHAKNEFVPLYREDEQVAGFLTDFGRIKFVSFIGSGEDIPSQKPQFSLKMITSFLQENPI